MRFSRSTWINCPPSTVFAFLRDKDTHRQQPGSPVQVLERVTPGPVQAGSRFVEVVRIMPFVTSRIESTVTRCDPPTRLEERFVAPRMSGYLAYEFQLEEGGTRLIQRETLEYRGLLSLFEPLIERMLIPRIVERLAAIKVWLESEGDS